MTTLHPRDALNKLKASPTPRTWQGAVNGKAGAPPLPKAFDLNAAKAAGGERQTDGFATPGSFRAAMEALTAKPADAGAKTPEDATLRKTAETLVNKMFVGTMLKQMRDSPFKDKMFSGGEAGQAYAGLFDQRLAEHAGGGIGSKLVDVLVKQFKKAKVDPSQLYADPKQSKQAQQKAADFKAAAKRELQHQQQTTTHAAPSLNLAA